MTQNSNQYDLNSSISQFWPIIIKILIVYSTIIALAAILPRVNLTIFYLQRQDWILLSLQLLIMAGAAVTNIKRSAPWSYSFKFAIVTGILLFIAGAVGHYWVLSGYDLSRDEQMATFDSAIFQSGRFVAALPLEWRTNSDALNTTFMYPVEKPAAWVSAYLPMNALLRVPLTYFGLAFLTSPLLCALGALALWKSARILWPDDREAAVIAILLYAGSGQILMTCMTSYAMTAHLALNLIWLWLFLQRRGLADVAAIGLGFIATGLHQPIFHPMFAAPILCLLLTRTEWRRAALYASAYGPICVFWLLWPKWMTGLVSDPSSIVARSGVDYLTRLMDVLHQGDSARFLNMTANLFRYIAWQHVLLIPLLMLSVRVIRRGGLPVALAAGVGLTILTMTIILPYQGHGFGYRYLAPVTGNIILLAVYGWRTLGTKKQYWRDFFLKASFANFMVLMPVQIFMAYNIYAPYSVANKAISQTSSDYAIIDGVGAPFSSDLVLNNPDLTNRPIRIILQLLTPETIKTICRDKSQVDIFGANLFYFANTYFGTLQDKTYAVKNGDIESKLQKAGCSVRLNN